MAKTDTDYEILLNSDTNAPNRCQWFYFKVSNTKKHATARFSILNQTKHPHFFNEGMKPMVFSELDNKTMYTSWTCKVDDCTITKTEVKSFQPLGLRTIQIGKEDDYEKPEYNQTYNFNISFSHTFKYDNDNVYFAFCKPYSFTRLHNFYSKIEKKLNKKTERMNSGEIEYQGKDIYYKREKLVTSLGLLPVDILTITSSPTTKNKNYIIITGRVHADETPGSHKVQGIIKFLLGRDKVAIQLKQEYVFLIIPMLNPDGVVMGNSRYSLGGYDLNRCWGNPSQKTQPIVFALKERLKKLISAGNKIIAYCDLHGHSKLYNSFIYACHKVSSATFSSWPKSRLLPKILSKKCSIFDYKQCSFKVEHDKLNTARVIIWKEFKVINSFTLESSMYAYKLGNEVVRFTERDYIRIGEALMEALHEYHVIMGQLQSQIKVNKKLISPVKRKEIEEENTEEIKDKKLKEKKGKNIIIRGQMCLLQAISKVEFFNGANNDPEEPPNRSGTSHAKNCTPDARSENNALLNPIKAISSPQKHADPSFGQNNIDPSLAEYFTDTELAEIVETIKKDESIEVEKRKHEISNPKKMKIKKVAIPTKVLQMAGKTTFLFGIKSSNLRETQYIPNIKRRNKDLSQIVQQEYGQECNKPDKNLNRSQNYADGINLSTYCGRLIQRRNITAPKKDACNGGKASSLDRRSCFYETLHGPTLEENLKMTRNNSFGKNNWGFLTRSEQKEKGCLSFPKETGFKNFTSTIDKRKLKGILRESERRKIMLKMPSELADYSRYYEADYQILAPKEEITPQGKGSSNLFSKTRSKGEMYCPNSKDNIKLPGVKDCRYIK